MISPGTMGENINSYEAFKEEKRMEKKSQIMDGGRGILLWKKLEKNYV